MKPYFFLFIFILGTAAFAQSPRPLELHPLLFRFEKEGVTFHILGTLHNISARYFPKYVFDEVEKSSKVIFEIENMEISNQNPQIHLPPGQKLSNLISPAAWAQLLKEINGEIPIESLETFQPGVLYLGLEESRKEKAINSNPGVKRLSDFLKEVDGSMDVDLRDFAVQRKIPIGGLEVLADQMGIFEITPYQFEEYLLAAPEDLTNLVKISLQGMTALTRGYFDGNFRPLSESVLALDKDLFDMVYGIRNHKWLPQMNASQNGAFYVVGSGHLVGPDGMRALLRRAGWKSTQVRASCESSLTD